MKKLISSILMLSLILLQGQMALAAKIKNAQKEEAVIIKQLPDLVIEDISVYNFYTEITIKNIGGYLPLRTKGETEINLYNSNDQILDTAMVEWTVKNAKEIYAPNGEITFRVDNEYRASEIETAIADIQSSAKESNPNNEYADNNPSAYNIDLELYLDEEYYQDRDLYYIPGLDEVAALVLQSKISESDKGEFDYVDVDKFTLFLDASLKTDSHGNSFSEETCDVSYEGEYTYYEYYSCEGEACYEDLNCNPDTGYCREEVSITMPEVSVAIADKFENISLYTIDDLGKTYNVAHGLDIPSNYLSPSAEYDSNTGACLVTNLQYVYEGDAFFQLEKNMRLVGVLDLEDELKNGEAMKLYTSGIESDAYVFSDPDGVYDFTMVSNPEGQWYDIVDQAVFSKVNGPFDSPYEEAELMIDVNIPYEAKLNYFTLFIDVDLFGLSYVNCATYSTLEDTLNSKFISYTLFNQDGYAALSNLPEIQVYDADISYKDGVSYDDGVCEVRNASWAISIRDMTIAQDDGQLILDIADSGFFETGERYRVKSLFETQSNKYDLYYEDAYNDVQELYGDIIGDWIIFGSAE